MAIKVEPTTVLFMFVSCLDPNKSGAILVLMEVDGSAVTFVGVFRRWAIFEVLECFA